MGLHPSPFCAARPAAQPIRRGDQIGLPPARDEERKQWFSLDRPLGLAPLAPDPHGKATGDDLVQIVGAVALVSTVVIAIHASL
ncbi:hypothetical protein GS397_10405 [Sphingobium yanoikuyae]|uniref:Uncharacterized protein n=1 Tax=Sphingobium yanoikuyae TaxID=13690 RepID=A0A6P1GH37_SPHYA|nr:hypothetical protein [Sphingobium yanoikuyae]QHD67422.1 hypothetical protein GS397_10405 [Sphingobium yanoikuyae]